MEDLIRSRQQFENEVYDLLVNIDLLVPPNFWDPVVPNSDNNLVNASNIDFQKVVCELTDCFICFQEFTEFNVLECCKKKLCENCRNTWFKKSVKCPFCVQDVRDFIK